MALKSEELNYLVYRYLLESGFVHSAYLFSNEGFVNKTDIDPNSIQPAALISLVQMGLAYMEIENHINEDGTFSTCEEAFTITGTHECKIKNKEKIFEDVDNEFTSNSIKTSTVVFRGHQHHFVTCCSWNDDQILATGAGDGATQIWKLDEKKLESKGSKIRPIVFRSSSTFENITNTVTSLCWHPDNQYLSVGYYDGSVIIFMKNGDIHRSLNQHKAAISSLFFNPPHSSPSLLLSTSLDSKAILWTLEGTSYHTFEVNSPVIDGAWRDGTSFAVGTQNGYIYYFHINENQARKKYVGHSSEINSLHWDNTNTLLATGGDDSAVRVWSLNSDTPICDLKGHTDCVTTVKWSPCPSDNEGPSLLISVSCSVDTSIKVWDVRQSTLVWSLSENCPQHGYSHSVSIISFNKTGTILAAGSYDRLVLWNPKTGVLIKSYHISGGINDLSWNHFGNRLAVTSSDHSLTIISLY